MRKIVLTLTAALLTVGCTANVPVSIEAQPVSLTDAYTAAQQQQGCAGLLGVFPEKADNGDVRITFQTEAGPVVSPTPAGWFVPHCAEDMMFHALPEVDLSTADAAASELTVIPSSDGTGDYLNSPNMSQEIAPDGLVLVMSQDDAAALFAHYDAEHHH